MTLAVGVWTIVGVVCAAVGVFSLILLAYDYCVWFRSLGDDQA